MCIIIIISSSEKEFLSTESVLVWYAWFRVDCLRFCGQGSSFGLGSLNRGHESSRREN